MAYERGDGKLIQLDGQSLEQVSRAVADCQSSIDSALVRYNNVYNDLLRLGENNLCNLAEIKKYINVAQHDCNQISSTIKYINNAYQEAEAYNMKNALALLGDIDKIPGKSKLPDKDGNLVEVGKDEYTAAVVQLQEDRRKVDNYLGSCKDSLDSLNDFLKEINSRIATLETMRDRGRTDKYDAEIAKLNKLKTEYKSKQKKFNLLLINVKMH